MILKHGQHQQQTMKVLWNVQTYSTMPSLGMEIKAVHIFQKIRLPSYAFFKCSTKKESAGYLVTFTHKAQKEKKKVIL